MSDQPDTEQPIIPPGIEESAQIESPEAPSADGPKLNPADAEADSDLSRPARAAQFRVERRSQISTAIPALLLIALGVAYLIDLLEPDVLGLTRLIAVGAGATALGVSLVLRFLLNG